MKKSGAEVLATRTGKSVILRLYESLGGKGRATIKR